MDNLKINLRDLSDESKEDLVDVVIKRNYENGMDASYESLLDALKDERLRDIIFDEIKYKYIEFDTTKLNY